MAKHSLARCRRRQLNPQNGPALSDLGDYYAQAPGIAGGGTDKAQAIAAQLDKVDPARAQQLRGDIADGRKDYTTAENEYRQAVTAASRIRPTSGLFSPISIVAASAGPIWTQPSRAASSAAAQATRTRASPFTTAPACSSQPTAIRRLPPRCLKIILPARPRRGGARIYRPHSLSDASNSSLAMPRAQRRIGRCRRSWRTNIIRHRLETRVETLMRTALVKIRTKIAQRLGAGCWSAWRLPPRPALAPAQVSLTTVVELAQQELSDRQLAKADVQKAQAALAQTEDAYIPNSRHRFRDSGYSSSAFQPASPPSGTAPMQSLVFSFLSSVHPRLHAPVLQAAQLASRMQRNRSPSTPPPPTSSWTR